MGMSENIELIYFSIHGGIRGLLPRLIMDFGGIKFKDTQVDPSDWPQVKPTTLLGSLPMLKLDGMELAQAGPIAKYLAQIGKMDKLNPIEELKSDMVYQTVVEVQIAGSAVPAFKELGKHPNLDAAKKAELF